ncbi:MAG TPA: hypothetical protein VJ549_03315, partial [Geothrix sp.]|nr:hypothetical protein [Geothrix sp.]
AVDPTVVVDANDGLGISVVMGFLESSIPAVTTPIDGSVQFTIMVVGGDSGIAWDPAKTVGSAPGICSLYEYGTGLTAAGYSIEAQAGYLGPRIKSAGPAMYDITDSTRKTIMFLTFDGTTWTLINKTIGTTYSKSNGTLGIVAPLTVQTAQDANLVFGHDHHTSTLGARPPTLYQVARWNRVLSGAEITDQTARTRASFPGLGL